MISMSGQLSDSPTLHISAYLTLLSCAYLTLRLSDV